MLGALDQIGESIAGAFREAATSTAVVPTARTLPERVSDGVAIMPAGGSPPRRQSRQLVREYRNMPLLRGVTSRIASDIAATTWVALGVRRGRGAGARFVRDVRVQRAGYEQRMALTRALAREGAIVEIEGHPSIELLTNPNPVLDGGRAWKLTQTWIEISGSAHLLVDDDGPRGTPRTLWPIPDHWIVETPSRSSPGYYVQLPSWQGTIPAENVISLVDPDPDNPYDVRGSGIMGALGDEFEIDEFAAQHMRRVFYNRARPDLIVALENASQADLARFEVDWQNRTGGVLRAFRPFFTTRKIDVKEISQSLRDLGINEVRKGERDRVLETVGMPPEIMGIIENSNRATIEAADYIYARHVLVPRLELIRSVLQERLAPRYDDRLIIDYVSPVTEDKEHALNVKRAAPWAFSADEWREAAGAEPVAGGGVYMTPFNLFPSATPGGGARDGERAATRRGGRVTRAGNTPDVLLAVADRVADQIEARYVALTEDYQSSVSVDAIAAAVEAGNVERVIEVVDPDAYARLLWGERFTRAPFGAEDGELLNLIGGALQAGADVASEELAGFGFEVAFDPANPVSVQWAETHAADLVTNVSDSTREAIRSATVEAIEARTPPRQAARSIRGMIGLDRNRERTLAHFREALIDGGVTGDELTRRIEREAARLIRDRAFTIARTEALNAANEGQRLLWEQGVAEGAIPATTEREWLTAQDERVDDEVCAPMHGQRARMGQPFTTPVGERMGPTLHPRCRCTTTLVL
jgi:hypothetical protein